MQASLSQYADCIKKGALRFTLKRVNLLNCDAALPSIQLFI